jgi:hypothetical protein
MQEPVRLVVDISGGAIHGTYAGLPVEIIFVSSDSDDIECADHVVADEEGKDTAVWLHFADGDQTVVDHFFTQMAAFLPPSR